MLMLRFREWGRWARVLAIAPWLFGCSTAPEPARKQTAAPPEPARIVQFYATPSVIGRGETSILCYSTANARTVRIDPAVETLSPSPSRCFNVAPERDTRYTLFAEGAAGGPVSQSLTLKVKARSSARPAPAPGAQEMITFLAAAATEIPAGQSVTVCYGVHGAASVRLEPEGRALPPAEKQCLNLRPSSTTTYTLVVSGPGGRTERERLEIRVK